MRVIRSVGDGTTSIAWVAVLSCVLAGSGVAIPMMDQEFDALGGITGASTAVTPSEGYEQTFTVGMAGALDSVALQLSWWGYRDELTVDSVVVVGIRNTDAVGAPTGSPLAVAIVHEAELSEGYQWVHRDFSSSGLTFSVGDVMAISVTAQVGADINWAREALGSGYGDQYAGGAGYKNGDLYLDPTDFGFRTYMEPINSVPEGGPAWLMYGIGLASVALLRRGRFG